MALRVHVSWASVIVSGAAAAAVSQAAIVVSAEMRYGTNFEADYVAWAIALSP